MSRRLLLLIASLGLVLTAAVASAPAVLGGGGCHGNEGHVAPRADAPAAAILADADLVVDVENCDFAPLVTNVPVGATVAFINNDAAPHQVTGHHSTWSSDVLEQGQAYAWHFVEAGIHPYSCPLHPGMVGAIVVGGTAAAPAVVAGGDGDGTTASTETTATAATSSSGGSGLQPLAAVAIGAASALVVLLIGGALARRRPAREHLPA
jgi:plastocyanin